MTDCVRQGRGSRQEGLAGCGRQADTHGTQNKQQRPRRLILAKHYFAHVFRTPGESESAQMYWSVGWLATVAFVLEASAGGWPASRGASRTPLAGETSVPPPLSAARIAARPLSAARARALSPTRRRSASRERRRAKATNTHNSKSSTAAPTASRYGSGLGGGGADGGEGGGAGGAGEPGGVGGGGGGDGGGGGGGEGGGGQNFQTPPRQDPLSTSWQEPLSPSPQQTDRAPQHVEPQHDSHASL